MADVRFSPHAIRLRDDPVEAQRAGAVRVLLVANGTLRPAQRARLEALGCRVHSEAGDVISAELQATALPGLADLDFLRVVELATPLAFEGEAGARRDDET